MTDEIPRLVAHGSLILKPEIASFDGACVLFKDGSTETVDLIVFATGYRPLFSFLVAHIAFAADCRSRFVHSVIHPQYANLFSVMLVQAYGNMWSLARYT